MERLWCLMTVRREIDVPQPEQLEFVPCGQLLLDEEEELGEPCPDKRPHFSHSQGHGDLPNCICAERLLGDQNGGGVTSQ